MSKLVRAKHPTTGASFTTSEAYAKRKGLDTVKEDAVDRFGRIRPATPAAKPTASAPTSGKTKSQEG